MPKKKKSNSGREKRGRNKAARKESAETQGKKPNAKQVSKENKTLRNIFIVIGVTFVIIMAGIFAVNKLNNFTYNGVDFKKVKFCDTEPCLILYQTSLPVIINGTHATYNLYFRNDPRKLDNVSMDGEINLLPNIVVNLKQDFNCDGDGGIALGNLVNQFYRKLLGANVTIVDDNSVKCNLNKNYLYIEIREGGTTRIIQATDSCYVLEVNNCEIMKVSEKFMIETLAKINTLINNG